MLKALRVSKTIISIAILLFVVLVIWGIYTAMNSAAGYTLSRSADALENSADNNAVDASAQFGVSSSNADNSDAQDDKTSEIVPPKHESSDQTQSPDIGTSADNNTAYGGSCGSSGNSSGGSSGGASSSGGGSSSSSSAPSTPSAPTSTYHPAWDEWVVEGHWDDVYVAATYGQRAVYGSVCNDCGANVSGVAVAHLKETHHSGYHEGVVGYKDYEISPAFTDKVWVDTSHWVHHPEYWG